MDDKLVANEDQVLEDLPLPGFPQEEAERRKAWSKLPLKARAAIRRLHEMLGHKPTSVVIQILKGARANPEYIRAAKLFRCAGCLETQEALPTHPVAPPRPYMFNHTVVIDVFTLHDAEDMAYRFVSAACCGTKFHLVALASTGPGIPGSAKCHRKFVQMWTSWAGWPQVVVTDRGTHNQGQFSRGISAHSVFLRQAA